MVSISSQPALQAPHFAASATFVRRKLCDVALRNRTSKIFDRIRSSTMFETRTRLSSFIRSGFVKLGAAYRERDRHRRRPGRLFARLSLSYDTVARFTRPGQGRLLPRRPVRRSRGRGQALQHGQPPELERAGAVRSGRVSEVSLEAATRDRAFGDIGPCRWARAYPYPKG